MSKRIYLDYAATTPVDKKVLDVMLPYFSEKFGNASSLHSFGVEASAAVENSRQIAADFFGAEKKEEIVFTSGATEANNLAIKGVVKAYYAKDIRTPDVQMHSGHSVSRVAKPHIVTSAFEHHCVLYAVKRLEKEGLIEATYIQPQKDGVVRVADIKEAIQKNTILVSVMYVNNEIGTVQPIAQIGKIVKSINKLRAKNYQLIFHTDATQAVNYFDCNVKKLGVDMMSMSAHKIYGPKGVGVLYIKKGTLIKMIQDGGAQENGMRAGTINSTGIVGLGAAIIELKNKKAELKNREIEKLRNYLIEKVLQEIPKTKLNGSRIKRSPNNANFSFSDVEGESLLIMLDAAGIAGSTGSACSSGSLAPSHVLMSLGMKAEEAHGSLRLTLGKYTTKKEIDETVKVLKKIISDLRKISGNLLRDYYKSKK